MANAALAAGNVVQFSTQGALATKTGTEPRGTPRRRMLKAGIIAYNNRFCTLPCMVRDVSGTGARLRLDGSVNAPDTFELIIESDGLEASSEVIWRKGSELGVRFIGAPRQVAAKKHQVVNAHVPVPAPSLRRKPKTPAPA
jgi:hypothetical protein